MSKAIILEARTWIGTRFRHQGRIKKSEQDNGGCDCLGLVLGIARNLGVNSKISIPLSTLDQKNYPKLLTSNLLKDQLDQHLVRVTSPNIGDIILIKINNWPQHLAIISEVTPYITIIHSYIQARKVVEQHLPDNWEIVAIYRFV